MDSFLFGERNRQNDMGNGWEEEDRESVVGVTTVPLVIASFWISFSRSLNSAEEPKK